jgi:hypothetical protein
MYDHGMRRNLMRFSLAVLCLVLLIPACDGTSRTSSGTPQPILGVNGTISAAGRDVVPTFGIAGFKKSGTAGIMVSDAPMGCGALDAEYTSSNMPYAGTYLAVGLTSFDKGVAPKSFVYFTIIPQEGTDMSGGGSNTGQVEVLDASDTAVTVKVEYDEDLKDGHFVVSGDFTVTRCP